MSDMSRALLRCQTRRSWGTKEMVVQHPAMAPMEFMNAGVIQASVREKGERRCDARVKSFRGLDRIEEPGPGLLFDVGKLEKRIAGGADFVFEVIRCLGVFEELADRREETG